MLLCNENAISSGNYIIQNSLRFQSASSQSVSRTPSVSGNAQKFTFSSWVKRGTLTSGYPVLYMGGNTATDATLSINFNPTDNLTIRGYNTTFLSTTAVYRDPSSWYHVVVAVDTTQATAANRIILYVNGVQVTATTYSAPAQNTNFLVNSNTIQAIGYQSFAFGFNYFDGYMAEIVMVDGSQLTPSSFGTTDPASGQWVAKKYTGTYGTNGFYLPFSNGTSTATLGADSSGNGNNWTLTNFTRSAGVNDCWMYDVPSGNGSSVSATQPNSNYAVMNPLKLNTSGVLANANLNWSTTATGGLAVGSIGVSSGKWYWENTITNGGNIGIGIFDPSAPLVLYIENSTAGVAYYGTTGKIYYNGGNVAYGNSFTTGDIVGVALDLDNGKVYFSKNGTWQNSGDPVTQTNPARTGLSGTYAAAINDGDSVARSASLNFGQRSFAYTPPSGFKALCTANLPVATIKQGNKYMDATLATGNNSTQVITNAAGFKPDMVWMKIRSAVENHILYDSVRGAQQYLVPNLTGAEATLATGLTSFNSNGFTLGNANPNYAGSPTFVAWQWQAGQGTTSSNTNGSITSTVSVNTTAGFSVVTYTGTGANATVGHGLGVAPKMMIFKTRSTINDWVVYTATTTAANRLLLNSTAASVASSTQFNNTEPTSSVFTVGTSTATNPSAGTMVAYCFAEIAGFSKFGSYTGNFSADGPFVYCGFKPKFVMIKCSSTGGAGYDWFVFDSVRNTYNVLGEALYPNLSNAAASGSLLDFTSNGFKLRSNASSINASAATFIFMAFAENPMAQSNSF